MDKYEQKNENELYSSGRTDSPLKRDLRRKRRSRSRHLPFDDEVRKLDRRTRRRSKNRGLRRLWRRLKKRQEYRVRVIIVLAFVLLLVVLFVAIQREVRIRKDLQDRKIRTYEHEVDLKEIGFAVPAEKPE